MKTYFEKIAHVTKIKRCYFFKCGFIFELREKPPHESLQNAFFSDVMRGFFSNFKNEAVFEKNYTACHAKKNKFSQNVTCYGAIKCDMW